MVQKKIDTVIKECISSILNVNSKDIKLRLIGRSYCVRVFCDKNTLENLSWVTNIEVEEEMGYYFPYFFRVVFDEKIR